MMHPLYKEDISYIANLDLPWSELQNKSILIVGASGLIGTCLVDALVYRNEYFNNQINICTMGRNRSKAEARFGTYLKENKISFIEQNITQPLNFSQHFDYYIHGASNTHPIAYASDPVGTITTNCLGMYNILEHAVQNHAKRILLISTVEIYGDRATAEPFKENEMGYINCNTIRAGYPESKRVAESLCQAYASKYGLDIAIGRLCRSYGPTMSIDDSKALAQFIRNAVNNEDVVLKSEGLQHYSYCYMADAVAGLLLVMLKGSPGEAYNISDPASDVHLKDIASVIAAQIDRKVIFQIPEQTERKGFSVVNNGLLDPAKINSLGFQAHYNIEDGVARTVKILKDTQNSLG